MLTEREVQILYESARGTVEDAMNEVTIDRHITEAEIEARTYARVLGFKYVPPERRRKIRVH